MPSPVAERPRTDRRERPRCSSCSRCSCDDDAIPTSRSVVSNRHDGDRSSKGCEQDVKTIDPVTTRRDGRLRRGRSVGFPGPEDGFECSSDAAGRPGCVRRMQVVPALPPRRSTSSSIRMTRRRLTRARNGRPPHRPSLRGAGLRGLQPPRGSLDPDGRLIDGARHGARPRGHRAADAPPRDARGSDRGGGLRARRRGVVQGHPPPGARGVRGLLLQPAQPDAERRAGRTGRDRGRRSS